MNEEQKRAERRVTWVYGWLFVSILASFFWAACLTSALGIFGGSSSLLGRSITTLGPAGLFLVLLFGLRSPYLFARRHTQQALLLALLVTILEWAFVGLELRGAGFGTLLILLLWFGGSIWGWRQVRRGQCWLMRVKGEDDKLPRPWALPKQDDTVAPERLLEPLTAESGSPAHGPDIKDLLTSYRNGTPRERHQAMIELERLGEVEVF